MPDPSLGALRHGSRVKPGMTMWFRVESARSRHWESRMDISSLALFAGVYFLAVASPGPAIAALVARSLSSGFRRSLPFLAGIVAGDLVWFTLTALGLSVPDLTNGGKFKVADHDLVAFAAKF